MSELDTSFTPDLYELEAQQERRVSTSKRMEQVNRVLDLVAPKMPTHIRDSPRMQEWVELLRQEADEESDERRRRMRREYGRIFDGVGR